MKQRKQKRKQKKLPQKKAMRWSPLEDVDLAMRKWLEKEQREAPHGRDLLGRPALPTVQLRGSYHNADEQLDTHTGPMRLPVERYGMYSDPSRPDERRGWFFYNEENTAYAPDGVAVLEEWFAKAISADESPPNLLNIYDDVKGCERLPARIKENLLFNIRERLRCLSSES